MAEDQDLRKVLEAIYALSMWDDVWMLSPSAAQSKLADVGELAREALGLSDG